MLFGMISPFLNKMDKTGGLAPCTRRSLDLGEWFCIADLWWGCVFLFVNVSRDIHRRHNKAYTTHTYRFLHSKEVYWD